jgi:hypothetical protein
MYTAISGLKRIGQETGPETAAMPSCCSPTAKTLPASSLRRRPRFWPSGPGVVVYAIGLRRKAQARCVAHHGVEAGRIRSQATVRRYGRKSIFRR